MTPPRWRARRSASAASTCTSATCRALVQACGDHPSIRRLVVRSSADVYAPPRGTTSLVDEDAPLDFTATAERDLVEADTIVATRRPGPLEVTILRCAELTVEAVGLLSALRNNVTRINAIAEEITRLEERADALNEDGIKALFLKHRGGDAMAFITGNEIYDHLEKVVDRFEDVANRISGIVLEQV